MIEHTLKERLAEDIAFYRRLSAEAPPYQYPDSWLREPCPVFGSEHGHDFRYDAEQRKCVGCGAFGGLVSVVYAGLHPG